MKKPTGGFAFPDPLRGGCYPESLPHLSHGMTLRQWYAGQIVNGAIAKNGWSGLEPDIARWAFELADHMIAEGEK